jgi:HJR/Mrr/RecB family endonuclease
MPRKPKLDLSEYDLLTAKDKLFEFVCAKAASWGMDPSVECLLLSPSQSTELGYGRFWHVVWEAGPYEWGIRLSMDGVTFEPMDGSWDTSSPEVVMGNPDDWYLEPYHSFDVGFVSQAFYAELLGDDTSSPIVHVTGFVTDALIKEIARHPKVLHKVERRQFERLVAELFSGFGYQVELTKQTRDGGKDVIALKKVNSIELKYLIECKRPDEGNLVAVATVRELLGVKEDDPASKALLVTTTDFTPDAKALINRHRWALEGKAYDDIVAWINEYNRIKGI